jgi:hypothetical protein
MVPEPAVFLAVLDLVAEGVRAGLPVPLNFHWWHSQLEVRPPDGDQAGVDGWAAWLSMPAPQFHEAVYPASDGRAPWRIYEAGTTGRVALKTVPGWTVKVWCAVDLSAEEIAALAEPVGEAAL